MRKFPPRIPPEEPELRRAIELLSRFASSKYPLTKALKEELTALLAGFPEQRDEARKWKIELRMLRKEWLADARGDQS